MAEQKSGLKALFVYDHRYAVADNVYYSSGAFSTQSWDRYLNHFDELVVVGHNYKPNEALKHLSVVSGPNVSFHILPESNSVSGVFNALFSSRKDLTRLIHEADVVIGRMFSFLAYEAFSIARKTKKTFVTEVVGCPWDAYWNHQSWKGKFIAPVSYFMMRRVLKRSCYSIYVTKFFLQKRYPTHGKSIHASNVMVSSLPAVNIKRKLNVFGNKPGTIEISSIGKIDLRAKGMPVLIKALKALKDKGHIFRCVIMGPGSQSYLEPLIARLGLGADIEFWGKVSHGVLLERLENTHLYIHPSMQEGLPRSVIEAMGRGCPVLASSIAGTPELIDKPYLHQPGNHKQLANQLIGLAEQTDVWRELAETNWKKARQEYDQEILAKRRFEFFQNVILDHIG